MKTFRLVLALLFFAISCSAAASGIRSSHSGSWYNPEQSGHGLSIQVLNNDRMVVYWFVYHPDGTPTFLTSLARIEGDTATGNVFHYYGMRFGEFDPDSVVKERWGTLSITFEDCNTALLSYDSIVSHEGIPFGSGDIEMTRLTSIDGLECILPHYGRYTATLTSAPAEDFTGESYIHILENGDLAYSASGIDADRYYEGFYDSQIGIGNIERIEDGTFRFSVRIQGPDFEQGTRQGLVTFEDGVVSLDLGELGTLVGSLEQATIERLELSTLAGSYWGWWSHPMLLGRSYEITAEGRITNPSNQLFTCATEGLLSIPNPASNQLVYEAREVPSEQYPDCDLEINGLGEYRPEDRSIYLIFSNNEGYVLGASLGDPPWK